MQWLPCKLADAWRALQLSVADDGRLDTVGRALDGLIEHHPFTAHPKPDHATGMPPAHQRPGWPVACTAQAPAALSWWLCGVRPKPAQPVLCQVQACAGCPCRAFSRAGSWWSHMGWG